MSTEYESYRGEPKRPAPNLSQENTLLPGDVPEPSPDAAAQVEKLAQTWQDLHDDGKNVSIEEVCQKDPALVPAVREYLSKVGRLEAILATQPPQTDTLRGSWSGDNVMSPPQLPDELGRLGGYRILKMIGQGGMGKVYLAEDVQLKRRVALKLLLKGGDQRFLREAQTLAAVEHDHIVTVYQIGEDRGTQYLAMQYLQGETLEMRLKKQPRLPLDETIRITKQITKGLVAAHGAGVVHRDIKPSNIWLEAGGDRVKILDFGLARTSDAEMILTQEGAVVGTPAYMAPEQAQGATIDHRVDLFSLGCCLYQMISGVSPFARKDVLSTLRALEMDTPESPAVRYPETPSPLSDLAMFLLAKKPADRPASAQAVLEILDAVEKTSSTPTHEMKPTQTAPPSAKTPNWLPYGLVGGAIAAGLAAVMFWPPSANDPKDGPSPNKGGSNDKPDIVAVVPPTKGNPSPIDPKPSIDAPKQVDLPPVPVAIEPPRVTLPDIIRRDFKINVRLPEVVEDKSGVRRLVDGQKFQFAIDVEEDAYVGIWYEMDDGSIRQLFPNEFDDKHFFKKGQKYTIPSNDKYTLEATPSRKMEAFRVIASTKPWTWDPRSSQDGFRMFRDTKEYEENLRGVVLVASPNNPHRITHVAMPVWVSPK